MTEEKTKKSSVKLSVKRRIIEISNKLSLKKTGENKFAKYKYFTPENIMSALNPLLKEYNLITFFVMDSKDNKIFKGKLIVEDCDSDERMRYRFMVPFNEVKGSSAAQAAGATLTYCKRYSLMNAFNIAGDDDLDKVVDGKNVKESKVATKQITVVGAIKQIKECKDFEKLQKYKGWVSLQEHFNENQKNVLLRNIEEQEKLCG